MTFSNSRREAITAFLGAGVAASLPLQSLIAAAAPSVPTGPIDTSAGKVRGGRVNGVSIFKGIPYGADTGPKRFQPAVAPEPWTGVRDCFAYGRWSPQAMGGGLVAAGTAPTTPVAKVLAALSTLDEQPVVGENCLVLNLFTPDASPRRKRPVMVWLHGGGFANGAGGAANYDGSNLCRQGDVVVVTLNHRLGAAGYFYLGALHDDFADSGNVGQLDIILALQWVRENIAAFGGDPGNVMVFGESGGGSKTSLLLAMPVARGLFHKAAIQSGPGLRACVKADVAEHAERTLAALGVAKADVHKLQTMDINAIIKAAGSVQLGAGRRVLAPVVDGRSLPSHPFDPKAPDISRDIPIIIGTNKDESTLFMGSDPTFGTMSAEDARKRFDTQLREKSAAAFEVYSKARPNDQPTYWVVSMATDSGTWMNSIRLAERKAAQQAAPAFMYRLDWETPVANGGLRSPHSLDIPLIFGNTQISPGVGLVGPSPNPQKVSAAMLRAWVNFARTGNPSQKGLEWPAYNAMTRSTMIFDVNSHATADPDREKREFWTRTA